MALSCRSSNSSLPKAMAEMAAASSQRAAKKVPVDPLAGGGRK